MIRFFDVFLSLLGLILLSPLFLFLTLLIIIDSKGPVFFKQIRVGKNEKEFTLLKFRSMYFNSENKGLLTIGEYDPRITKVGTYIRKYKLDELPQLINVLFGNMSLVGPRPEVRKYVKYYTEEQKVVFSVKPGITDYASIVFRNENELLFQNQNSEEYYINFILPEKLKLNLIFIKQKNIFKYFLLIIITILLTTHCLNTVSETFLTNKTLRNKNVKSSND